MTVGSAPRLAEDVVCLVPVFSLPATREGVSSVPTPNIGLGRFRLKQEIPPPAMFAEPTAGMREVEAFALSGTETTQRG